MSNTKTLCFTCNEAKVTYLCKGCSMEFCLSHLQAHREELNARLEGFINDYDRFRQTLREQQPNQSNVFLVEQIDQWELAAIETIRNKAKECREVVMGHLERTRDDFAQKLHRSSAQITEIRNEESKFNEIDLQRLVDELATMKEKLTQPKNISLHKDTQVLARNIRVTIKTNRQESKYHRWIQHGVVVAGGNGLGQQLNRLNRPFSFWVHQNRDIFIVDQGNHRIARWDPVVSSGTVVAGGNGKGNRIDQLTRPTDVIVDPRDHSIIVADQGNKRVVRWFERNTREPQVLMENIACVGLALDNRGFLYAADWEKHGVRRWKEGEGEGKIVAGGKEQGNRLDQLSNPTYIFVDDEQSVYVSDWRNHRVMKWRLNAKEGVVLTGGNGSGLDQLCSPNGVVLDRWGRIYVADSSNDRVVRWCEGDKHGEIVVGGNGRGQQMNQVDHPVGLSFDDEGNLYVSECENHRIRKFDLTTRDDRQ